MWYLWLIFAGVFLVIEAITVSLLTFWLALGALLAMVTSFFTDSIVIQTTVFVVSSSLFFFAVKPIVNKYITNKPTTPTNVDSLIKKHGIVTVDINSIESTGQVKVNGEVWSAKCNEDAIIPKGTAVEVIKVDGVKLVVSPLEVTASK